MAFGVTNGAPELSGLTPNKTTLASNYVNFNSATFNTWAQQYLPEVYEQEVERYGNRSVSSFLRLVGAEMPMASDQIVWSEQGRLHQFINATLVADGSNVNVINAITAPVATSHSIRKGSTVIVQDAAGKSQRALVTLGVETSTTQITVAAYANATGLVAAGLSAGAVKVFVFGTEFGKGTNGMTESLTPEVNTFSNKPIILKDKFEVSGSDASQIGWIEVSGESGQSGYLWYMKAEGDARTRFEDYVEMAMVESEERVATHAGFTGDFANATGTQGLFAAIDSRGIEVEDMSSVGTGSTFETNIDLIIQELDKQGAIEENMLFLNRATSLAIDSGLASQNSYGSGGTSYGVFENSEDMALNLGFSGFRRGSYDFYKTDWKYLNNEATRGQVNDIEGILVPAGTSSVYDQIMGKNIRRPFLHVRYRASEADDRKMKSWVTGSVGGAATSDLDAMQVNYLSERCLVVQAANNFVLFENYSA
mgnify:FL=1|jgi:hypothetical protein